MADGEREGGGWMSAWRGVERKVNKLLVSLDSPVETQGRAGEVDEKEEEKGRGGGRGVGGAFSSSLLRPVGLPGYQTVWSWWWDAGVRS